MQYEGFRMTKLGNLAVSQYWTGSTRLNVALGSLSNDPGLFLLFVKHKFYCNSCHCYATTAGTSNSYFFKTIRAS
jgi:hypothetical protein